MWLSQVHWFRAAARRNVRCDSIGVLTQDTQEDIQWGKYYDQLMYGFQPFVEILKQALAQKDQFDQWLEQVIQNFDHYRYLFCDSIMASWAYTS